jgi:hypothetical protein
MTDGRREHLGAQLLQEDAARIAVLARGEHDRPGDAELLDLHAASVAMPSPSPVLPGR